MSKYDQLGRLTQDEETLLDGVARIKNLGKCGTRGAYRPIPKGQRSVVSKGDRLAAALAGEREHARRVFDTVDVVRIPNDPRQIFGRECVVSGADPGYVWVKHS